MSAFRAESRQRVAGPQPAVDEDSQSVDAQEQFEITEWLGRALLKLPFEQRAALELMYRAGYSCEEVGEIMGCPASTVKTRMFHARRKLRHALPVAAGVNNGGSGRLHSGDGDPRHLRPPEPGTVLIRSKFCGP